MKKQRRSIVHRLFKKKRRGSRSLIEELQGIPLFSRLSTRELLSLEQILYARSYKQGEPLFSEGTPGYALFIIRHGVVDLTRETANGEYRHIGHLHPGDILGELVILCAANRNFSAVAEEDCEVAVLFKHDFMEFVSSYPKSGVKILQAMTTLIGERYLDLIDSLDQETERGGDHAKGG